MKMQREGLEVSRFGFAQSFVPYDELIRTGNGVTRDGRALRIPDGLQSDLSRVLDGPPSALGFPDAGAAFRAYVEGPWSPTRAAQGLLQLAAKHHGSDVHLEATAAGVDVRFRLAGELEPFASLRAEDGQRLIAALKHLSGCVPYRRDLFQEGRIRRDGVAADVRASFIPTALGERVALRLFGKLLRLEELGFDPALLDSLRAALTNSSGLLLIAGPSGGGKTTTMYAMLRHLAESRPTAHLSIEDPVEQRLRLAGIAVDQVELCPERGLTADAALVAALRQDVDVLAVGEIRAAGEAELAVQAAHSGRLVLAGIHAGNEAEARMRMVELGVDERILDKTLKGVLHQRLETIRCEDHLPQGCGRCGGTGRTRAARAVLGSSGGAR